MTARLDLAAWSDASAVARRLAERGLSAPASAAKAGLLGRCARALEADGLGGGTPARAFFVPGRIEVLGKHTDYAGGRSLIAAAEPGIVLVAAARGDASIRARALDLAERCDFPFSADVEPPVGRWANYPMTVARRLARDFPGRRRGVDAAFVGDLPPAAGMSSSSALMVAWFLALAAVNRLDARLEYRAAVASPEALAEYLGAVENGQTFGPLAGDRGVGTFGGSEDHTAMLCSRPGSLAQYAYCPVRLERRVPMPAGYAFAIASSGVAAEKTGPAMSAYNRASRLAADAARAWREATGRTDPHLAAALASGERGAVAERMRGVLRRRTAAGPSPAEDLLARFSHFLAENEEVLPAAGDALADGRLDEFGRLVDRSQHLAGTLLGNQVPQTRLLARAARDLGAAAASAFGAGFGGSVWALVPGDDAAAFLEAWAGRYRAALPEDAARAAFFTSGAGPAAMEV